MLDTFSDIFAGYAKAELYDSKDFTIRCNAVIICEENIIYGTNEEMLKMSGKKILVITGSPRVDGNSDRLADAFIEGAISAENSVVRFDAGRMNIGGCKACDACFSKEGACSISSGFNTIAPEIEKSDVIVFVTPMYWFNFPAQLKNVIDKFYSFGVGGKDISGKECELITCGGTGDESDFDGLITTYKLMIGHLKWENRGTLIVTGVNGKGEVKNTGCLAKAEEMGRNI